MAQRWAAREELREEKRRRAALADALARTLARAPREAPRPDVDVVQAQRVERHRQVSGGAAAEESEGAEARFVDRQHVERSRAAGAGAERVDLCARPLREADLAQRNAA